MRKKTLTRFQLVALLAVTGLVFYRVFSGPPAVKGTVTINDVEPSELKHVTFRLDAEVVFGVDAVGSFSAPDKTNPEDLAVYGWVVDQTSREVVWKMQDTSLRADQTLATAVDTLSLPVGQYKMYFTSYGNLVAPGSRGQILGVAFGDDWIVDADEWRIILNAVTEEGEDHVTIVGKRDSQPPSVLEFWSTGIVSSKGIQQHIFDVVDPVSLDLYSIGEYCNKGCDFGGIVDYATEDTLWVLSLLNSEAAGGMQENIRFKGEVELEPGTYRAFYQSNKEHAFGDWRANPPFDPMGWGMTLSFQSESDMKKVHAFDPWEQREPIISITRLGSDENRRVPFEVLDTVSVVIYGVGELTDSGSRYDYAILKDVSSGRVVWEMTYEDSEGAGGDGTNRKVEKVMDLYPGRYSLTFQTDGSHDYSEFTNGEPDNPERWGVTMFAFSEVAGQENIRVLQVEPAPDEPSQTSGEVDAGEVIVNSTQLGNGESVTRTFELSNLTIVRIVAAGEITSGDQYDYGWIEDVSSGSVVWEMTRLNTEHGGGDDHNRRYEGLLELAAGSYNVYFKTDFSHAFGDFGDGPPTNPSEWGIRVEKIISND